MKKISKKNFESISLLGNEWKILECEDRSVLSLSQKNNIKPLLAKLLLLRNIKDEFINDFLNPNLLNNIPNPFLLKDMKKAVTRVISAIVNNEKIGIIADYDVDGSTSAAILYKFLQNFEMNISIKIPNRLSEGYGPNLRIMDELLSEKISLIFTLDCGTTSCEIIDNNKYKNIDVIVIDHHLSELNLPKVHSIINPNRFDELQNFNEMAAVGITFLFIMALRNLLRKKNFFNNKIKEPNIFSLLDLVALGTVCDVVNLTNYNRMFVKTGLDLIKSRRNKGISKIIDNSNLKNTPTSKDLGFIVGPQLNAASRLDDSSLPTKLLITKDISEIELISRKLILLNEKRKLIENQVFQEALIQAQEQISSNFIIVSGDKWHNGVLGIVASKLINEFNKPTIVISFTNSIGVGSARSINGIDLGLIILEAKKNNILISGGGHNMAAGLKINLNYLDKFNMFLNNYFESYPNILFKKNKTFDAIISINEVNESLLNIIEKMEPFGAGNFEPNFVIKNVKIENIKILKDKHILIFIKNDFSDNLKAICFNSIGTNLGDYLINFKKFKFDLGCSIQKDNFNQILLPQIIIKDAMIVY